MKLVLTLLVIAAAVAGVMYFGDSKIGGVEIGYGLQSMLYGAMAVSIAASLLLHYRGRMSTALLGLIAWIGIFGIAVVGYSYRTELAVVADRVMDEVVPGREIRAAPGEATAVRGFNGHFSFAGITNGARLRYMFDTGASAVVLRHEDAARAGLKPERLDFSVPVSTANGRTLAAPATIDALTIGDITLRNVRALVGRPGALQENLLGMSFLGRLKGYAVEGNRLVLRQ